MVLNLSDKRHGDWDRTAERMMLNFAENDANPILRATSVAERGDFRSNGKGKKSVQFNGSEENIDSGHDYFS